jgi:hypothetical protein
VKDPSGGVVAKADVRAVNEATNEEWSTTTDQVGGYSFFLLPPGFYRIDVAASGFKTAVLTEVVARITETTPYGKSEGRSRRLTSAIKEAEKQAQHKRFEVFVDHF